MENIKHLKIAVKYYIHVVRFALGAMCARTQHHCMCIRSECTYFFIQINIGNLEIKTVDKFQGRDKSCILVSLVRSNKEGDIGNLLQDWRRLNVAFTRAKAKLIIIGSLSTLDKSGNFNDFIKLFREQGWIYDLPSHANEYYCSLQYIKLYAISDSNMSRNICCRFVIKGSSYLLRYIYIYIQQHKNYLARAVSECWYIFCFCFIRITTFITHN